MRPGIGVILLALFAAGGTPPACTPLAYVHREGITAQIEADKFECGELAREQAFHASFGHGWWRTPYYPWWHDSMAATDSFLWRVGYERDLYDFCMRVRGYRLMPIK
jgi:hypothetical protein